MDLIKRINHEFYFTDGKTHRLRSYAKDNVQRVSSRTAWSEVHGKVRSVSN